MPGAVHPFGTDKRHREGSVEQLQVILITAILLIAFIWTVIDYRRYLSRYNVEMTYGQFLKSYWNRIWRS